MADLNMRSGKKDKHKINNHDPNLHGYVDADKNGNEIPSAIDRAMDKANEALKDVLKKKVEELEIERSELETELSKERAKVQNIRRRADEDKSEALKYANYDMAFDLLNVLDCFEMGADCDVDVAPDILKPYIQGVEYTIQEMTSVLAKYGIKAIPTDIPFDPEIHTAFECIEAEGVSRGTIVDVKRKGYMLHERVLRNALVTVAGSIDECPTGSDDE